MLLIVCVVSGPIGEISTDGGGGTYHMSTKDVYICIFSLPSLTLVTHIFSYYAYGYEGDVTEGAPNG